MTKGIPSCFDDGLTKEVPATPRNVFSLPIAPSGTSSSKPVPEEKPQVNGIAKEGENTEGRRKKKKRRKRVKKGKSQQSDVISSSLNETLLSAAAPLLSPAKSQKAPSDQSAELIPSAFTLVAKIEPPKSNRQLKSERNLLAVTKKFHEQEAATRDLAKKEGKLEEFERERKNQQKPLEGSKPQRIEISIKPWNQTGAGDPEVCFLNNKKKRERERELVGSGSRDMYRVKNQTSTGGGTLSHTPNARKKLKVNHTSLSTEFPLLNGNVSINGSKPSPSRPPPNTVSATSTPAGNERPQKGQLRDQSLSLRRKREKLPIWKYQDDLREALRTRDILVMLGETGSGKSTQIGQFLLNEPWMKKRKIVSPGNDGGVWVGGTIAITQPRRVAAISLARRVAAEMGVGLGEEVGYTVRFDNKSSERTRIKFLTDGMLIQEMLHDPLLKKYSCVVVDEAHERTVGTDLVMGFLKGLVYGARAGVMKVVVMSATLEMEKMKIFFENKCMGKENVNVNGAKEKQQKKDKGHMDKVKRKGGAKARRKSKKDGKAGQAIEIFSSSDEDEDIDMDKKDVENKTVVTFQVPGRQFPVELYQAPEPVADYVDASLRTVFQIHYAEPLPGDILVFLTGQEEIESLQKLIEDYGQEMAKNVPKILVLPLYAALPHALQQKVFLPAPTPNTRKIILSTNIAETSVTVSGVRHVVDCGKVKTKQFRPRIGLESLLVTPVSKSSALQRTGRAGREAPGKCYRLYTEDQFLKLQDVTVPEILRCDVASAILMLKARGVENVMEFDYLDPPSRESMVKGLEHLFSLGALDNLGHINTLGKQMARLPLTPTLARVLLAAAEPELDCLSEAIDIIAALSTENILLNPAGEDKREEMEEARKGLQRREGDHLMLLGVVREYENEGVNKSAWAERHFVSHRAMKQLMDVRKQLRQYCLRLFPTFLPTTSTTTPVPPPHATRILKAFLKGFSHNTARLVPDGSYRTIIGSQAIAIHPSSSLFGKKVEAIMYDEFVYTTRPFARNVAAVQMDWLMEAAPGYFGATAAVVVEGV